MAELNGFWSYAHADDEAEGGRITRLARDVVAQYQLLTGEKISLFLDRADIEWGEKWRDSIDNSLASVAFFIPVLTPRFFMSTECRRELRLFARNATHLGVKNLVLPLLYVEMPALCEEEPEDDLVAMVKSFQWEDWQKIRFSDVASEDYRTRVAQLAARIVKANREAKQADVAVVLEEADDTESYDVDDTPGLLDRLADAEEALLQWTATLEGITQDIEETGRIMDAGGNDIRKGTDQGHGFAARLRVTKRIAHELAEPIERIWARGNDFASLLHTVDDGIRIIIAQGAVEIRENRVPAESLCSFFGSLRYLTEATKTGLESVQEMVNAIKPIEKTSRDMRPLMRRLRQGLTTMVEAGEVSNEWVHLIESSGVECRD